MKEEKYHNRFRPQGNIHLHRLNKKSVQCNLYSLWHNLFKISEFMKIIIFLPRHILFESKVPIGQVTGQVSA